MTDPEALLGGRTRFCIIEALAEAKQHITAYQIAMVKGLDPAATYRCLVEFSNFGLVESETKGRNQTFYRLSRDAGRAAADLLRALVKRKSESNDLEEWLAPKMQAKRMAKIARLDKIKLKSSRFVRATGPKNVGQLMSKRIPGELSALIESSKIAFNGLFLQQGSRVYLLRNNK